MKKFIISFLFCIMLASSAYAGPSHFQAVDCKFDDGSTTLTVNSVESCSATKGTIAVDTNWFPTDISPIKPDFRIPVRHTLQFSCPTATVINIQVAGSGAGADKLFKFNTGSSLAADSGYQFSFILLKGITYNIQHKTGTQNCSVFITETFSDDL